MEKGNYKFKKDIYFFSLRCQNILSLSQIERQQFGPVTCRAGVVLLHASNSKGSPPAALRPRCVGPVGSGSLRLLNLTRHHWQSGTRPRTSHVLGGGLAAAFVRAHRTSFCASGSKCYSQMCGSCVNKSPFLFHAVPDAACSKEYQNTPSLVW